LVQNLKRLGSQKYKITLFLSRWGDRANAINYIFDRLTNLGNELSLTLPACSNNFGKVKSDLQMLHTKTVFPLTTVYIGDDFKAKMLATVTRDMHYCTCLGNLGQSDREIGSFLFLVVLPKVANASTIVTVACHCHQHFCLKIIANVHKPLQTKSITF
jgi:hypothetical protein